MSNLNCYLVKIVDTDVSNKPIESGYFVKASNKIKGVLTAIAMHGDYISTNMHNCIGNTSSITVEDRYDDGGKGWVYMEDKV